MSAWMVEGDYAADGAVCVRQAFAAEHVVLAREAIEENLADLSPRAKRASADDDGAFIEDFCNWSCLPKMERFIRESPGAEIAGELTDSNTIRLYHDHMLVKEPGPFTARAGCLDQTGGASCRFGTSAMTWFMRLVVGRHRHPLMGSTRRSRAERRWTTYCFQFCGPDQTFGPVRGRGERHGLSTGRVG